MNLFEWLETESRFPKVFWQDKKGFLTLAGVGEKHKTHEIPYLPSERYFGGRTFDSAHTFFFLPEVVCEGKTEALSLEKMQLIKREDSPSYPEWEAQIASCLDKIKAGHLHKIVLARKTTFTFKDKVNPLRILSQLESRNATRFAFILSEDKAFIGASPEMLYIRQKDTIFTEAVAGTCKIGESFGEKERREFDPVKEFLFSTLSPLCDEVECSQEDQILQTHNLQHLYCPFSGRLRDRIGDEDLIAHLHPTPALGGFPRSVALEHLRSEPFERGWYGAPFGWISTDGAEMTVAIRSALIEGNQMHLFAGVGIVIGSDPKKEWEELEHKIAQYTHLFS